jgi:hypothetical protein
VISGVLLLAGCGPALDGLLGRAASETQEEPSESAPAAPPPVFPADAPLSERLAFARRVAQGIVIDGRPGDWAGLPTLEGPAGGIGDPSLDLVGAAIAPLEDALLLRLDVAGPPAEGAYGYWVNLDLYGSRSDDLRVGLRPGRGAGTAFARVYQGDEALWEGELAGAEVAAGAREGGGFVEARLPWEVLAGALAAARPGQPVPALVGEGARSWVRLTCFSWHSGRRERVDHGPSAASYRLDPALDPDPPLPRPGEPPLALPLPLEGQWHISQGGWSEYTHGDRWAYDLLLVDEAMESSSPRRSAVSAEHYAWGRPVFAPLDAEVVRVVSDQPDHPSMVGADYEADANRIYLDVGQQLGLDLAHFQEGSLVLQRRSEVPAGTRLGVIGNSGRSNRPHLHMALWERRTGGQTVPIAFRDVVVGLNPTPSDPWARPLAAWTVREGFFVERAADAGRRR